MTFSQFANAILLEKGRLLPLYGDTGNAVVCLSVIQGHAEYCKANPDTSHREFVDLIKRSADIEEGWIRGSRGQIVTVFYSNTMR